ncbi:LysR family transcriptional regulator, partial [Mammaliicoccus vitulinus]
MEIKQMQYFIEVAKFKSMTKASENLYITQPTISNSIKLLEEELSVELFDRSKRQIVLTDAGKVFYKICKDFLKMYENIPVELNNLLEIEEGHVRIGIPTIMNVNRFTKLISEFHQLYPNVT